MPMVPDFITIGDPEPSDAEIEALARLLLSAVESKPSEVIEFIR